MSKQLPPRTVPARCVRRKQLAGGLWGRAEAEGARTQLERRNFGIADDVYAAGLFLAYMAFIPFCTPGSIDAPSLQRCGALRDFWASLTVLLDN